jgi:hypothetical protein
VLEAAAAEGIGLRLAGGLAIAAVARSAWRPPFLRDYHDLDFVGLARQSKGLQRLLRQFGFVPNARFNTIQGSTRLMFTAGDGGPMVEVFLDAIRMSHTIELRRRLELVPRTLAPADLLLAKMQVVELTRKDATDVLALLTDVPLGESDDGSLNLAYLRRLASDDWGFFRTIELNVARIEQVAGDLGLEAVGLRRLFEALQAAPKTRRWKVRAKIGERVRWYDVPEEALRPPTALGPS